MPKPPHTRPPGAYPRPQRPRPPSTRPPSSAAAAARAPHEVYVQIANLQMAKTRQQRIRAALQVQVERCAREIAQLDAEIARRLQQVGLVPRGAAGEAAPGDAENEGAENEGDDGFAYDY